MLRDLRENFNWEIENIQMNQSEIMNKISEKANVLEGMKSWLDEAEDRIGGLEDTVAEMTQSEQAKRIQNVRVV